MDTFLIIVFGLVIILPVALMTIATFATKKYKERLILGWSAMAVQLVQSVLLIILGGVAGDPRVPWIFSGLVFLIFTAWLSFLLTRADK